MKAVVLAMCWCNDEEACNYDSEATIDDNSCEYANINFTAMVTA